MSARARRPFTAAVVAVLLWLGVAGSAAAQQEPTQTRDQPTTSRPDTDRPSTDRANADRASAEPQRASPPKPADDEPPPDFLIIVHRKNPIDRLPAKTLSRMFLKKIKRWDEELWPDGVLVEPVDLREKSEIRKLFTRAIHDKSTSAIKSYWQRELFSGRDVPPSEADTDEEVMEQIANEEGGIGYVSGTAQLLEELKVLEVADDD